MGCMHDTDVIVGYMHDTDVIVGYMHDTDVKPMVMVVF